MQVNRLLLLSVFHLSACSYLVRGKGGNPRHPPALNISLLDRFGERRLTALSTRSESLLTSCSWSTFQAAQFATGLLVLFVHEVLVHSLGYSLSLYVQNQFVYRSAYLLNIVLSSFVLLFCRSPVKKISAYSSLFPHAYPIFVFKAYSPFETLEIHLPILFSEEMNDTQLVVQVLYDTLFVVLIKSDCLVLVLIAHKEVPQIYLLLSYILGVDRVSFPNQTALHIVAKYI